LAAVETRRDAEQRGVGGSGGRRFDCERQKWDWQLSAGQLGWGGDLALTSADGSGSGEDEVRPCGWGEQDVAINRIQPGADRVRQQGGGEDHAVGIDVLAGVSTRDIGQHILPKSLQAGFHAREEEGVERLALVVDQQVPRAERAALCPVADERPGEVDADRREDLQATARLGDSAGLGMQVRGAEQGGGEVLCAGEHQRDSDGVRYIVMGVH